MADDTTKFVLDLDATEFVSGVGEALDKLGEIGDSESISGLSEDLITAAKYVGVLGAAFFAVKESLNLVFEAENIKAINAQFQILTAQAGISGRALKESLETSSNGLIDETELMKMANKAIIEMGGLAKDLGPIMDLARRQGAVFGISTTDAFEQINQAIATGQTRMLRHLGIMVDQKKAYDDYAKSIGVAGDELSKEGQQHAILNAVLAKTSGLTNQQIDDIKKTTTTWEQFKTSLVEIKEIIILVFDKTLGPMVYTMVTLFKGMADAAHQVAVMFGGTEFDKARLNVQALGTDIQNAEIQLKQLEARRAAGGTPEFLAGMDVSINNVKNKIAGLKEQATQAKTAVESIENKEDAGAKGAAGSSPVVAREEVDLAKRKENQAKFYQELAKLKQENAKMDETEAADEEEFEDARTAKKLAIEQQYASEVQKIHADIHLSNSQKNQLIEQQDELKDSKLRQLDNSYQADYDRMLKNMVSGSQTAGQGIANAFHAGTLKAQQDLKNFGNLGQATYTSFTSHAKSALMDLGAGTKSATDVMKGFFFGMLADQAEQYGTFMLLASVWPPNPVGLAGGAALLVLAGFLKSQSGGSSTSSSSGATASTSGDPTSLTPIDTTTAATADQTAAPAKTVSITVQGSYFETEQTKTALVDMIRQASDATDFNIKAVGETG